MKIKLEPANRGIALMMVMLVILVLGISAALFARAMKVELTLARNASRDFELDWLGRSGVEFARYWLAAELGVTTVPFDALIHPSAAPQVLHPAFAETVLANLTLNDNAVGDGTFSVRITDLERKWNINSLLLPPNRMVLQQILLDLGVDAGDLSTIVESLIDWVDADDDEGINGAESSYYLRLEDGYFAKNGLIDDLSELLLVRGITPELYWGSTSTNAPRGMAFQTPSPAGRGRDEAPFYPVGLRDIFTTISSGRINFNTAPVETLTSVPGLDANWAAAIKSFRAGPDGVDGTEDDMPLRTLRDLPGTGLPAALITELDRYGVTRSFYFEVEVDARIGDLQRTYVAVIYRQTPRDMRILRFNRK